MGLDISFNNNLSYWKNRYEVMGGKRTVGGKSWSDKHYATVNSIFFDFAKETIGEVNTKNCNTLVDFGCGIGRCTSFLKEVFKPQKYIGMDIINKSIVNVDDAFYLIPKSGNLNLEEASIDVIWTNVVLQHVIDEDLLSYYLNQFWKALKAGGKLITVENTSKVRRNEYIVFRSESSYINMFKSAGFKSRVLGRTDFTCGALHSIIVSTKEKV